MFRRPPQERAVVQLQAQLAAAAATARRLDAAAVSTPTPTPTPAPTGVLADGTLEERDYKRLIGLADAAMLRRILQSLSRDDLLELQARLDDADEDEFTGNESLASGRYLMDLYHGGRLPPVEPDLPADRLDAAMPPVALPAPVEPFHGWERDAETTTIERRLYATLRDLRRRGLPAGTPPPPGVPQPAPGDAVAGFGFSYEDLGYRMALLDRHIRPVGRDMTTVSDLILINDLAALQARMVRFFRDVYLPLDAEGRGMLRQQAHQAAPLDEYDLLSPAEQQRQFYAFVWARTSEYYRVLYNLLMLHYTHPGAAAPVAFRAYVEGVQATIESIAEQQRQVGKYLGRFLVLEASTSLGRFFSGV